MKKHLYLLAFLFFATTMVVLADNPPPIDPNPDPIPADGGITALIASGGLYAYRKLRGRKKAK